MSVRGVLPLLLGRGRPGDDRRPLRQREERAGAAHHRAEGDEGPVPRQQNGLYAGLVVEPENSTWRDSESGVIFGGRDDGGPTSWRADILTSNEANSYREFLLEFGDFQHAYKAGGGVNAQGHPVADPDAAINPPAKEEPGCPTC